MAGKLSRTCQKCGETDVTEFSTCRYCKKRYVDKGKVVVPAKDFRSTSSNSGLMGFGLVVILLLSAFVVYHFVSQSGKLEQFLPHKTVNNTRHR
jgi:hypothetical protein